MPVALDPFSIGELARASRPGFDVIERRLQQPRRLGDGAQRIGKSLLGAMQTAAHGGLAQVEHVRELGPRQLLPVVQLDQDLVVDGDAAQTLEQQALLGLI